MSTNYDYYCLFICMTIKVIAKSFLIIRVKDIIKDIIFYILACDIQNTWFI